MADYSPGPWRYCGEDSRKAMCSCGIVWSEPDDHPVAKVEYSTWGEHAPALELSDDRATARAVMEFIPYGQFPHEERVANGRLIAAAPDLLEALEMVRDADNDEPHIPSVARSAIDHALRKAKGEA